MGINAIRCERNGGVKESVFGKGHRSSSDFDGADLLKAGAMIAAVAFAAGCVGRETPPEKLDTYSLPRYPQKMDAVFTEGDGGPKAFHSERTNSTYLMKLEGHENFYNSDRVDLRFSIYRMLPGGEVEQKSVLLSNNKGPQMIEFGDNASLVASTTADIGELFTSDDRIYLKVSEIGDD